MIAVLVASFSFPFYSTPSGGRDSLWHGDGPVQRSSPKYECLDQNIETGISREVTTNEAGFTTHRTFRRGFMK